MADESDHETDRLNLECVSDDAMETFEDVEVSIAENMSSRWDEDPVVAAPTQQKSPEHLPMNTSSEPEELFFPPTPEHVPPGSKTPPPSTSQPRKDFNSKRLKRRSKSLDMSGRASSPETEQTCPICLGELDNKSMTDTCLHKFCFTCLLEWSKVKPECPLCKGKFSAIIHNVRSDSDYDRYSLPPAEPRQETGSLQDFLFSTRRFRYHTTMSHDRQERRRDFLNAQVARMTDNMVLPAQPYREVNSRQIWRRRRGPGTSDFRREVYTADLWAQPLSDITNRFRECSPEWYRTNEAQTHRLVPWLNRELNALLELSRQQGRQAHLITQIVDWVKLYHIDSPDLRDQLLPYLGTNTEHFQHEFYNFARTPFDLVGYDRNVTYANRRLGRTEVVSSDTSSDEERAVGGPGGEHVQFMEQLRTRLQESQHTLSRLLADRMAANPALSLGTVTNYPERERTRREEEEDESGLLVVDTEEGGGASEEGGAGSEEKRRGLLWSDRRSRSRDRGGQRREPEGYRREMDRFWGIRSRMGEGEVNRRRKSSRPSKYSVTSRSQGDEAEDEAGLLIPIDLSVRGGEGASTSRGEGAGLTRLVIPDSDEVSEEDERDNTEIEVKEPAAATSNEVSVTETVTESLNLVIPEGAGPVSVNAEVTAPTFIPLSTSTTSLGFYTDSTYSSAAIQFLDPLTGLLQATNELPIMTTCPPDITQSTKRQPEEEEEDNSDLEVIDVVKAKPPRRINRDPEVVELSDSDQSDNGRRSRSIEAELARQSFSSGYNYNRAPPPRSYDPDLDEPVVISSDSDEENPGGSSSQDPPAFRMRLNNPWQPGITERSDGAGSWAEIKSKKKAKTPPPPAESSSEDDLIVVKTEHCTIDPITKKQITEPVRNKKCNHIYEKSTIYSMIDSARENQKSVRCPYMGCNQKDFKKTDLVRDREVLGHLNTVREEKEKAELEKIEKEKTAMKERKKRKREQANESDRSADSIVEEVIEMIKDQGSKNNEHQGRGRANLQGRERAHQLQQERGGASHQERSGEGGGASDQPMGVASSPASKKTSFPAQFSAGDKVFAKIEGYPYWPATVTSLGFDFERNKYKYTVVFPNSQMGMSDKIEVFNKEMALKFLKQRFKAGGKNSAKEYKKAVQKIEEERRSDLNDNF